MWNPVALPLWAPPITVDAGVDAEPWRLSMIGIRSNSEVEWLLESIPESEPIGPSCMSVGVEFDAPIMESEPYSPLIDWNDTFTSAGSRPTDLAREIEQALSDRDCTICYQNAGAPPQNAHRPIVKPAAHPSPVDMGDFVDFMIEWFDEDYHATKNIIAALCNEAGHSLQDFKKTKDARGNIILPLETDLEYEARRPTGKEQAAQDHAQMLAGVSAANAPYTRWALGTMLSGDFKTGNGKTMLDGTRNFFEGAMDYYADESPAAEASVIAFNNFNGRLDDITGGWGTRNNALDLPGIISQKAPGRLKIEEDNDGDGTPDLNVPAVAAACDAITDLVWLSSQQFEYVCHAYYMGGFKFGLVERLEDGTFIRKAMWHGIHLASMIPTRLVSVVNAAPVATRRSSLGVHAIAGVAPGLVRMLLWNDSRRDEGVAIDALNMPAGIDVDDGTATLFTESMAEPTAVEFSTYFVLPHESIMLLEWRASTYVDTTARRKPLGAETVCISNPMEANLPVGGWGKYDAVRGVAQALSHGQANISAVAVFEYVPTRIYLTRNFYGGTSGSMRIYLTFAGSPEVSVSTQTLASASSGSVLTLDLDTLGGAIWAASALRRVTVRVNLNSTTTGTVAEVWFSTTSTIAATLSM